MNAPPTEAPEARLVLRNLLVNRNGIKQSNRAINVSFRHPGGATGRRDFVTHWLHWYPAKMFHRIPSVFLDCVDMPTQGCVLYHFCVMSPHSRWAVRWIPAFAGMTEEGALRHVIYGVVTANWY